MVKIRKYLVTIPIAIVLLILFYLQIKQPGKNNFGNNHNVEFLIVMPLGKEYDSRVVTGTFVKQILDNNITSEKYIIPLGSDSNITHFNFNTDTSNISTVRHALDEASNLIPHSINTYYPYGKDSIQVFVFEEKGGVFQYFYYWSPNLGVILRYAPEIAFREILMLPKEKQNTNLILATVFQIIQPKLFEEIK